MLTTGSSPERMDASLFYPGWLYGKVWMDSVRAMAAGGPVLFQEPGPRPVVTPLVIECVVDLSPIREQP